MSEEHENDKDQEGTPEPAEEDDARDGQAGPEEAAAEESEPAPALEPEEAETPDREPGPPAEKRTGGPEAALIWVSAFLIVMVGVIAYSNGLSIPLLEEDQRIVEENTGIGSIVRVPGTGPAGGPGPLALFTLALNKWINGDEPAGYHAVNVFLHLLCAVLVYLLCRQVFLGKLKEPVAMVSGMLFAVHPACTSAVNQVTLRSYVLATCFVMVSLILYLRATKVAGSPRPALLVLSMLSFLCAWLSKEAALVLPVLLFAVDWVVRGREGWAQRLRIQGAYWGALAAMVVVQFVAAEFAGPDGVETPGASVAMHVGAVAQSLQTGLTGRGLSVQQAQLDPSGSALILAWATVGLVAVVALVMVVRRSPLGLALLWAVAALVAGGVLRKGEPVLADQRLYLALTGAVLVIPWFFSTLLRVSSTRVAGGIAVALLIAASGVGTFVRNTTWNDPIALWLEAEKATPDSVEAQRNLGRLHLERGQALLFDLARSQQDLDSATIAIQKQRADEDLATAQSHLEKAQRLAPDNAETTHLRGVTLELLGRPDEALEMQLRALEMDPMHFNSTLRAAVLLQTRASRTGSHDDLLRALDYYQYAQRLDPESKVYLGGYGMALAQLGEFNASEATLFEAVREDEQNLAADAVSPYQQRLDEVRAKLAVLRPIEEAIASLRQENPQAPELMKLHAELMARRKQFLHAAYALEPYLARNTADLYAWILLGYSKAAMGEGKRFLEGWPSPPAVPEGQPSAWLQLARRCAEDGLWDEALAYLESESAAGEVRLPLLAMGEVAFSLQQVVPGYQYLRQATEAYESEPMPWLRLCDFALTNKDMVAARGYLAEAEKRNADPADLALRREQLPEPWDEGASTPVTTIR